MSTKDQAKKNRERQIMEAFLTCRSIQYSELVDGESPDFEVKLLSGASLRFELVEMTDPNERSVVGKQRNVFGKLHKIHVGELNLQLSELFNSVFSNAIFKIDLENDSRLIQKSYEAFLKNFAAYPESFRNFSGDPNSSKENLSGVFEIVRIDGLTSPQPFATGMTYWVDSTHKAVSGKFLKPYATEFNVTILVFWKPHFVPGNPNEVRARLEEVVQSFPNIHDVRVVGFDTLNNLVFFEHPKDRSRSEPEKDTEVN
jgi:hypothetical protein